MDLALKQLVESAGWLEAKKMFEKEILGLTDTKNIKETLSAEHIKMEIMAMNKASKTVTRVLKKIQTLADNEMIIKNKQSYR